MSPFNIESIDLDNATILDIQAALEEGKITSRQLVFYYLSRIANYDQAGPRINSVLQINPDAIFIAEALDLERQQNGSRGLLHGIPILVKDNIETGDKMRTTAGSLALEHNKGSDDAFLVKQLRQAGAIILGKTNLTELANGVSSSMVAGYSSYGGQVLNPYGEFFPGGSSTGSSAAVAMNFASASIGTETTGSILSPSTAMSIVGLKPTVGLISRTGIIPFSYSQDTPGPMAKNVTDVAVLLDTLVQRDEEDPATWRIANNKKSGNIGSYVDCLNQTALEGARIGVFRDIPQEERDSDEYDELLYNDVILKLKEAGAEIVDAIEIPSFKGPWDWNKISIEFKHGLDNYLNKQSKHNTVHSLSQLIKWNEQHSDQALKYGQDALVQKDQFKSPLNEKNYIMESITDLFKAQHEGIDYALNHYKLDVILFPSCVGCDISARAGYPSIAIPAGYQQNGTPFGITFSGTAFSESTLLSIGYAFEQLSKHRKLPKLY